MRDPYLYPSSDVLINKFNEQDIEKLNIIEAEYTSLAISEITENPLSGEYDFKHFCSMHYEIFKDIYNWAGKPRIINMEKSEPVLGGISIEYAEYKDIEKETSYILLQMNLVDWDKKTIDEIVEIFSKYMTALWKIHPFREGNTRTVVTFCCQFIESKGVNLTRKLFEENAAYVRNALVASSAIFKDMGDLSKPEYLIKIVKDSIEIGSSIDEIR